MWPCSKSATKAEQTTMTLIAKHTLWAAAAVLALWLQAFAPTSAHAGEGDAFKKLWLGSAWYPEQWPEARWDQDLALMQAAGMNVVRIGEFAWSSLEPSEGQYDLEWMARAIRMAEKRGMVVVLGTPTNTPPAWLTSKYPDTLRIGPDGRRNEHGGRRSFRSPACAIANSARPSSSAWPNASARTRT